jgi:hypothetical protein
LAGLPGGEHVFQGLQGGGDVAFQAGEEGGEDPAQQGARGLGRADARGGAGQEGGLRFHWLVIYVIAHDAARRRADFFLGPGRAKGAAAGPAEESVGRAAAPQDDGVGARDESFLVLFSKKNRLLPCLAYMPSARR